jgi:hypothetical protein
MSAAIIRYVVGVVMILFAIYQIVIKDYWESALYITAGLAFITMGLITDDVFPRYRKAMNVISWILIFSAAFFFLFLLRTDQ